ncbi:MAG: NADH-ubiquinone oxidoreductase-F iron-sulfur binding region domain-containing protein [Planctomycetota bacterium]|jgi:NADH-quinone oxidoreductase subunit F
MTVSPTVSPNQASTNQELIDRHKDEPAPLLPILHAFHDRDGFLSEESMRAVAAGLKIPIADLYGAVTFYHHFSRVPNGLDAPRVCTGPVCCLQGGNQILDALSNDGAVAMPCSGSCDQPVPVLRGHTTLVGADAASLRPESSPLPPPNPGGHEECVFAGIREQGRATIAGYERGGGYVGLKKAVTEMTPGQVVEVITESKLAGRGGAGFPTGVKWQAVAEALGEPKSIVCNADEGEPGCFKDRAIMDHDPHQMIEGMILAAYATGAVRGFIYLRYEYPETFEILKRAIDEARRAGYLGDDILGKKGVRFEIHVRRGAGAYICGEEGSLLNSLEGKHPFPRNRPPFPVTHGFEDKPTVVNNVETLASVPPIVRKGAQWYQGLGMNGHAGTKLISLSGDIQKPANYEVPLGLPLRTLLHEWAGGPPPGQKIQAVTMAGLSGGFLAGSDLDEVSLDEPSIRSKGSFLGAGGIIVFDDSRDMIQASHSMMSFFAHESCGKCFPCRIGTQRLTERLRGEAGPEQLGAWTAEVADIGDVMKATSACGLGMAAPLVTDSLLRYFPEEVARHVENRAS